MADEERIVDETRSDVDTSLDSEGPQPEFDIDEEDVHTLYVSLVRNADGSFFPFYPNLTRWLEANGLIEEPVEEQVEVTPEHYAQLTGRALAKVMILLRSMRAQQQEIDDLKAETRAMLRKLRAA